MCFRRIVAVTLLAIAIGCTVYAACMWAFEPVAHYHAHATTAIFVGCILASIGYNTDTPKKPSKPEEPPTRPNGFSLIQLLCVLAIAILLMAIGLPAITSAYRSATTQAVDAKVREVAIEKMYEDRGLTFAEIYAVTAKAEWTRKGWAWPATDPIDPTKPYYFTPEHVAAQLELLGNPAFEVPHRTSAQALIDLGLPEPEAKKELGMQ